jgi:SagB-type dehydrogenase family enzyme
VKLVLSSFTSLRREGAVLVAECGGGPAVQLEDPAAVALVGALTQPRTLAEAAAVAGISAQDAERLAEPLVACGALVDDDRAGREAHSAWTAPELLVHRRSRTPGVIPASVGRPPPALPAADWAHTVSLPAPDLERLEADDPPLAAVQAARRSIRAQASEPLTVDQLAEFLYRVGRVVDFENAQGGLDLAVRPYPSADGLYELELYPLVGACSGLDAGLYHYAADHHRLGLVTEPSEATEALRRDAAAAMGGVAWPQVLVIVAGRIGRLAWRYGPLSYTLMLKDTGALLGTMYLAATAMGLAGCAVATGDATLFAEASGLCSDDQAPVGEFSLGTPSADELLDRVQ